MKKTAVILGTVLMIAVLTVLILTSCGSKKAEPVTVNPAGSPSPALKVSPTPTPTEIPLVISTPTPQPSETPAPKPAVTPTPTPTPTPTAKPTPTPTPQLPVITKSPTDETVDEGGSCYFVAKYENALIAVWHFVSPDGQTDLTYEAAQKQFENMEIINGMYSTMQLKNIPYAANGWRVYCRYSNNNGYSDTKTALITVRAKPNPTPTPSPDPTDVPVPVVTGFSGTWAEEVAKKGTITISQTASGVYAITAEWPESAAARDFWTMEATDNGNGTLTYSNAVLEVRTYSEDGSYTTETRYTDGSGFFQLDSNAKLVWTDMKGDISTEYRFILVG